MTTEPVYESGSIVAAFLNPPPARRSNGLFERQAPGDRFEFGIAGSCLRNDFGLDFDAVAVRDVLAVEPP